MRRMLLSILVMLSAAAIIPAGNTEAGDKTEHQAAVQSTKYDGFWLGSGKITHSRRCRGSGEIPIAFLVQDSVAKSLIQDDRAMFTAEVQNNGGIQFRYQDLVSERRESGTKSMNIQFSGKLGESEGKGFLTFGTSSACRGRWTVSKQAGP